MHLAFYSITSFSLSFFRSYFTSYSPTFLPFLLSLSLFLFFIYSLFSFLSFLFLCFLSSFSLLSSILFLFVCCPFSPFSIHRCFQSPFLRLVGKESELRSTGHQLRSTGLFASCYLTLASLVRYVNTQKVYKSAS